MQNLKLNNIIIESRPSDNFINATQMCKAGDKLFADWARLHSTHKLITALQSDMVNHISQNTENNSEPIIPGSQNTQVIEVLKGNSSTFTQGSWIHPDLAVQLAQWISPTFAIQVSRWIRELFITGSVSIASQKTDTQLNELINKLQISESKNIHLISQIQNISLHQPDGYIYIATCTQYEAYNHYRFGRTENLKSRLSSYQVGRTIDDQMYYVFEYKTEKVAVLEQLIRKLLEEYRQDASKDIYILQWHVLHKFILHICNTFTNIIVEKNILIQNNLLPYTTLTTLPLDNPINILATKLVIVPEPIIKISPQIIQHVCHKCNKVFRDQHDLDKHLNRKFPCDNVYVATTCEKCNKLFPRKLDLDRHINRKYPCDLVPVSLTCSKCYKVFTRQSQLDEHLLRKYPCDYPVL